jgi:hypothetical protein
MEPGESGDEDDSERNSLFETPDEGAVLEGTAHKLQTVTVSSMIQGVIKKRPDRAHSA